MQMSLVVRKSRRPANRLLSLFRTDRISDYNRKPRLLQPPTFPEICSYDDHADCNSPESRGPRSKAQFHSARHVGRESVRSLAKRVCRHAASQQIEIDRAAPIKRSSELRPTTTKLGIPKLPLQRDVNPPPPSQAIAKKCVICGIEYLGWPLSEYCSNGCAIAGHREWIRRG